MVGSRKCNWGRDVLVFLAVMQIGATLGISAEIRVPDDYATITEALAAADHGDVIGVAAGVYSSPQEEFPLRLKKSVVLQVDSSDPNDRAELRGDGTHTIVSIESGGVSLRGFRITEGLGSEGINNMDGGGICIFVGPSEEAPVCIENCIIENCSCPSDETYDGCGGGIYCGGTYCTCFEIIISNCTISDNTVRGCGGGVFCALLSNVSIQNTFIEANTADDHGGGMFVDLYASADVRETHLVGNNCPGDPEKEYWGGKGGGLACESLGIFTLTDCLVSENAARYFGGGIFTRGGLFTGENSCGPSVGRPQIAGSRIEKNRADVSGGGVYMVGSSVLDFSNTTLYWNDAGQDGGGVFVAGGVLVGGEVAFAADCLIEGNESGGRGGGAYLGTNALGTFQSTRLSGNSALFDGGGLFLDQGAIGRLTNCQVTYNNSARRYGGAMRISSEASVDLDHCSVVGNFAPHKHSGLYLDPNSAVTVRDSILWHNAGGSIEDNAAVVSISTSLCEDGADPDNGVICCDPSYVGWGNLEEVHVDALSTGPGTGTSDDPYHDLQVALDGFSFQLAGDSACVGTASDGGDMGAATGIGGAAGNPNAVLRISDDTYDIRGRNIIFIQDVEGIDPNGSVIENAVFGCVEGTGIRRCTIAGEAIYGGIVVRDDATFEYCHISGNTTLADGGGAYIADGNCVMTDTLISANTCSSGDGGGIYASAHSNAILTHSIITSNATSARGGGAYFDANTVSAITDDCEISSNLAAEGGGVYVAGFLEIDDCNLVGNRVEYEGDREGGAIYVDPLAEAIISDCNVASNYAAHSGGGLMCEGNVRIERSRFTMNAANYGGAIISNPSGVLYCDESSFVRNSATYHGGAIYQANDSKADYVDSTFEENEANRGGAGICWARTEVTFEGCHTQNNYASNNHGGAFYLCSSKTCFRSCSFTGDSARHNGGVAHMIGSDTSFFEDCVVEDAVCGGSGGAFCMVDWARPVFLNVSIQNSRAADYGGGVSIWENARPTFTNAIIRDCQAIYGGGLYASGESQSRLLQCELLNNRAYELSMPGDGGGAYFTEDASGSFMRCLFQDNYAIDDGGGMGIAERAQVALWNTAFAANQAEDDGGGIHFTSEGQGKLTNCTLTANSSIHGGTGGAIYLEPDSTVLVDSSVIWDNAPDGIRPEANPNVSYSCTQKIWPGLGNIMADPCLAGGCDLQPDSPCIDAGNPDPNMNDACRPPGQGDPRNDMGCSGGPQNCNIPPSGGQFEFTAFDDPTPLVLRGNASLTEGSLRLNDAVNWQVGGAWYPTPVAVADGFTSTFDFRINQNGADGLAFVIQNAGLTALGSNGASIGYNIPNSIAIEFDTYRNGAYGDTNANHISVQTRGTETNSPYHEYSFGYTDTIPFFSNNQVYEVTVTYVPGKLSASLVGAEVRGIVLTADVNIEDTLSLTDGCAFVGFTASTGGQNEEHDILSWSFASVDPGQ